VTTLTGENSINYKIQAVLKADIRFIFAKTSVNVHGYPLFRPPGILLLHGDFIALCIKHYHFPGDLREFRSGWTVRQKRRGPNELHCCGPSSDQIVVFFEPQDRMVSVGWATIVVDILCFFKNGVKHGIVVGVREIQFGSDVTQL